MASRISPLSLFRSSVHLADDISRLDGRKPIWQCPHRPLQQTKTIKRRICISTPIQRNNLLPTRRQPLLPTTRRRNPIPKPRSLLPTIPLCLRPKSPIPIRRPRRLRFPRYPRCLLILPRPYLGRCDPTTRWRPLQRPPRLFLPTHLQLRSRHPIPPPRRQRRMA